jgi:hypothetical protein
MAALRKVTTDEFWLAVAHANGIHDDDAVRKAAGQASIHGGTKTVRYFEKTIR